MRFMPVAREPHKTTKETAMSTPAKEVFPSLMRWETEGSSRIPFMAYTGENLHKKEL
jgi:hypothetical protein